MVGVTDEPQLRRHVEVRADTEESQARVREVGLAVLARTAKRRQQAIAHAERHAAAADERYGLADPVARLRAGDRRVLEDGVEAARLAVKGIAVARGVDASGAKAHPVEVARELERAEPGADTFPSAGERAALVRAERVVAGRARVPAA